jgi:hypothetical protein
MLSATSLAKPVKCVYIGIQPGFRHLPAFPLYNLLEDLDADHRKGSTVSLETIHKAGRYVPSVIL